MLLSNQGWISSEDLLMFLDSILDSAVQGPGWLSFISLPLGLF